MRHVHADSRRASADKSFSDPYRAFCVARKNTSTTSGFQWNIRIAEPQVIPAFEKQEGKYRLLAALVMTRRLSYSMMTNLTSIPRLLRNDPGASQGFSAIRCYDIFRSCPATKAR